MSGVSWILWCTAQNLPPGLQLLFFYCQESWLLVVHRWMNVKHLAQYMTPYRHTAAAAAKSLQLYLTLCDPIDGSPPGSSVPGILQVRILEWVAISFSDLIAKSRLTLWNPMDHIPPGSSVYGISQARIPEWVAVFFSSIEHSVCQFPSTEPSWNNYYVFDSTYNAIIAHT